MNKRYLWGFFFLFVQIIAILRNYIYDYNYYFWFCDFAPILFSIAFFINNKNLVKGLINFGLIPQIIFLIDFIYVINSGTSILGVQAEVLKFNLFAILSGVFIHLTTLIALSITFRFKTNKKTLAYSILFMFAVYFTMLIFTPSTGDINYVYSTGTLLKEFNFDIPNIVFIWPILTFLLVILPTQSIQYFLYRFSKNRGMEAYNNYA